VTPPLVVKSIAGLLWWVDVNPGLPDKKIAFFTGELGTGIAPTPGGTGIASITEAGLITLTDGRKTQLNLPSGKGIKSISASGLVTFSDNSTQQLNLGSGKQGIGIAQISQPTAGTVRFALTDGTSKDVALPASTVPGPVGPAPTVRTFAAGVAAAPGDLTNYAGALYPVTVAHTYGQVFDASKHAPAVASPGAPSTVPGPQGNPPSIVPFAKGTAVLVGNLTNYAGALYPVTVAHTFGDAFDASKHGAPVASPGPASTVAGPIGPKGHFVGANPAAAGPVLIIQGGTYVTADPGMLAALAGQLFLKGSDGLYVEGLVPLTWPSGTAPGHRLVLQTSGGGNGNVLWLALKDDIPNTLGTPDNAYVLLGTAGVTPNTVIFRPDAPLFDNTIIRTGDRFTATAYASVAALEAVYTKLGSFATYLYDDAGQPVSGRTVEISAGQSARGVFGYLRTSYPTGAAAFDTGSVTVLGRKGGGTGQLVAILQASGSGSTYTAIEVRLNSADGSLSVYSVVKGVSTQLGTNLAKGVANDAEWWIRVYAEKGIVRARAWPASAAEPSAWDFDLTQSTLVGAGLGGFRTDFDFGRFGFFGVSRGDALAPVA